MTHYRIRLTPDDNDTLLVTCPAFPEVTTFGADELEACVHAGAAIEEAIAARIARGKDVPRDNQTLQPVDGLKILFVRTSALTDLKVDLYNACRAQGVSRAELARRLKWSRNSVDRLFMLDHNSRLEQIETAAAAIGLELQVALEPPEAA